MYSDLVVKTASTSPAFRFFRTGKTFRHLAAAEISGAKK